MTPLKLSLLRFMSYDRLEVEFRPGLTLVVGDNGAGKSTVIEGVCWTLYGDTIRGGSPAAGGLCEGTLEALGPDGERYSVHRAKGKNKSELLLKCGILDLGGQTPTITQQKIDAIFGDLDRFRATRVFAREFMLRFATATDKERKALLESILGLGRFDKALELVRTEARTVDGEKVGIQMKQATHIGAVQAHTSGLERLREDKPEASVAALEKSAAAGQTGVEALKEKYTRLVPTLALAQRNFAEANTARTVAAREVRRLEAQIETFSAQSGPKTCRACGRPFDSNEEAEAHAKAEIAKLAEELTAAKARAEEAASDADEVHAEFTDLQARHNAEEEKYQTAKAQQDTAKRALDRARDYETRVSQMQVQLDAAKEALQKSAWDLAEVTNRLQVLSAVGDALGLRGARVLLFGRALAQLEAASNEVLRKLGLPISVSLSDRAKLKSGAQVDTVSVKVKGAGGGDYFGASGGERTRVDVALMLALAQAESGWLAFDEVFDTLDGEGVERVATYLGELAESRPVLVISHNSDMVARFPRAQVWRALKDDVSTLEVA